MAKSRIPHLAFQSPAESAGGHGSLFMLLEQRIAFDAAGLATLEHLAEAVDPDAGHVSEADAGHNALLRALAAEAPVSATPRREVVFVDTSVVDVSSLLKSIDPGAEVVMIDATRDGVNQIAAALEGRRDLAAIHIISHGGEGNLSLGTAHLDSESMRGRYAGDLAAIGAALGENGDILVYGCDFARGEEGAAAARLLAGLTGADVAASSDGTGAARLGGDWDLEQHTGAIEAYAVVDAASAEGWDHLLAAPSIDLDANSAGVNYADTLTNTSDAVRLVGFNGAISAPDANLTSLRIDASGVANGASELLNIAGQKFVFGTARTATATFGGYGGYSFDIVYDGANTFTITKTGGGSWINNGDQNTFLRSIAYSNSSVAATGARVFTFTATDSGGATATATSTITITQANTAPIIGAPSGVLAGEVAAYSFDNGTGNAPSSIFGGPTMTVTPAATYANAASRTGDGYGLSFAGGTGLTPIATLPSLPGNIVANNAMAVSGWIRFDTTANWSRFFEFSTGTDLNNNIALGRESTTFNLFLQMFNGTTALGVISIPNAITNGAWMHITATFAANGEVAVYTDGALASKTILSALPNYAGLNMFRFGTPAFATNDVLKGAIDDVHIFDRALNASEVQALYGARGGAMPTALDVLQDSSYTFSTANGNAITIGDATAGSGALTTTLSISQGTLTLGSATGLTVTGNGTSTVTVTGTIAATNAALNGLVYVPTAGWSGFTTLDISVNDNGNTGTPGPMTTTDSLAIQVSTFRNSLAVDLGTQAGSSGIGISWTPQASVTSGAIATAAPESAGLGLTYSAGATQATIGGATSTNFDQALTANDYIQETFTTAANMNADTVINFVSYGQYASNPYTVTTLISNDNFATSTVLVRDFAPVSSSGLTINTKDVPDYQLVAGKTYQIRHYVYNTSGGNMIWDEFSVRTVADSSGTSTTYVEGGGAVPIAVGATLEQVANGNLLGATVVITNAQAGDILSVAGTLPGGITAAVDTSVPGQVTLTLSGAATLASYQSAIGMLRFDNTGVLMDTTTRNVTVSVTDGIYVSNTATSQIKVVSARSNPSLDLGGQPVGANMVLWDYEQNLIYNSTVMNSAATPLYTLWGTGVQAIGMNGSWNVIGGAGATAYDAIRGNAYLQHTFQVNGTVGANYALTSFVQWSNSSAGRAAVYISSDGFKTAQLFGDISLAGYGYITVDGPDIPLVAGTTYTLREYLYGTTGSTNIDGMWLQIADDPTGYSTFYVEGDSPIAIASGTAVEDANSTTMAGATIILTNAKAGDRLSVWGALPAGITSSVDTSVAGQITLTLSGTASNASYQQAINQVRFSNTRPSIDATTRTITVTVSDGAYLSNTATCSIGVMSARAAPALDLNGQTTAGNTMLWDYEANAVYNPAIINTAATPMTRTWGSGLTATASGGSWSVAGGTSASASDAIKNNDYFEHVFQVNGTPGANYALTSMSHFLWPTTGRAAVYISSDGFKTAQFFGDFSLNGSYNLSTLDGPDIQLTAGKTYALREYIYGATGSVVIDGMYVQIADDTTDFAATFTGQQPGTAITSGAVIEDGDGMASMGASIVLTNAQPGDLLSVTGTLPIGINAVLDTSVSGKVTLTLSGGAMNTRYQTVLGQVRFYTTSTDTTPRIIEVTTTDNAYQSNTATTTITMAVTRVSAAPAGADKAISLVENATHALTVADFGFSDAGDSPTDSFIAVKIASLPSMGTLTLAGVAVTAGQTVTTSDIAAGRLVWAPAANTSGTAAFTFQVMDNGVTTGGGQAIDQSPNTITFNVAAINRAPSGADSTVTTPEDTAHVFAISDFGFTDLNDSPADALAAVKISAIPSGGSLTLNGAAVTAGQSVTAADITAGKLRWTPAANASGTGLASFTFQVQDDGGTANGGVDLDPSANTITFDVTSVNDAPAGADKTVTMAEDTAHVFAISDFGFSDMNDSPANTLSALTITTLPSAGSLTLDGIAVTAGQSITAADIAGGKLRWTPAANASGASLASVTFQVGDDGGTASGGVDLDPTANTITFDVAALNDIPVARADTGSVAADSMLTKTAAEGLLANDEDADSADVLRVTAIDGFSVSDGQTVTLASGARLTIRSGGGYAYDPNGVWDRLGRSEAASDGFTYTVSDGAGGVATASVILAVSGVDDPLALSGLSGGTVAESALAGGTAASGTPPEASGTFTARTGDAMAGLTVNGLAVTGGFQSFTGAHGTLHLDGYDAVTGKGDYRYVLSAAADHAGGAVADSFVFEITDIDGDRLSRTLAIDILDDAPSARSDRDEVVHVAGNPSSTAYGNVLDGSAAGAGGSDPNRTDGVADTLGADAAGATVTSVFAGLTAPSAGASAAGSSVSGLHGSLLLLGDGRYAYTPDHENPVVSGLGPNDELSDIFTYEITDGDGSRATGTLTITILGTPALIDLADIALADAGASSTEGRFEAVTPKGLAALTVAGRELDADQLAELAMTPLVIPLAQGTLTLQGFDAGTGALDYTYARPASGAAHGPLTETVVVTARDMQGDATTRTMVISIPAYAPAAPEDPADPVEPTDPGTSGGSGDTGGNGGTTDPGGNGGTSDPGGPADPGTPSDPTDPDDPVTPADPEDPGTSGGSGDTGGSTDPGGTGGTTDPGSPPDPDQPSDPDDPVEPVEPGDPVDPAPGGDDGTGEPETPSDPVAPPGPTGRTDPAAPAGVVETAEPAMPASPQGRVVVERTAFPTLGGVEGRMRSWTGTGEILRQVVNDAGELSGPAPWLRRDAGQTVFADPLRFGTGTAEVLAAGSAIVVSDSGASFGMEAVRQGPVILLRLSEGALAQRVVEFRIAGADGKALPLGVRVIDGRHVAIDGLAGLTGKEIRIEAVLENGIVIAEIVRADPSGAIIRTPVIEKTDARDHFFTHRLALQAPGRDDGLAALIAALVA